MPRWALIVMSGSILASLFISLIIVWSKFGAHPLRRSSDVGPQHVHREGIARTGGFAIVFGLLCGVTLASVRSGGNAQLMWTLVAIGVPIFGAGVSEDLLGRVAPRWRYYASLASASLAFIAVGAHLNRVDIAMLDAYLVTLPISFIVTVFCVAGVAQAYNIMDGKNGLSAGLALVAFYGIGMAAWGVRDFSLAGFAFACAGAMMGFLLLNYPRGLIFLGDGGAYLSGFYVATLAVLLVVRQPGISAWYPLILTIIPVLETVVSFVRRLTVERQRFDQPDHLHMHSLIYRSLFHLLRRRGVQLWLINALTALPLIAAATALACAAYLNRFNTPTLQLLASLAVTSYIGTYLVLRQFHKTSS